MMVDHTRCRIFIGASTINKPQLQKIFMANNLHKTMLEIKRENTLLKEEKAVLEKDNAKLKEINNNLMDSLRSTIEQCQRLIKHTEEEVPETISLAKILVATELHESYQELIALLQQSETDFIQFTNKALPTIEYLHLRNEKYTNAPNVKHQIADDFWAPWRERFDAYKAQNMGERRALKKIQKEIENSGQWSRRTKDKHSVPNISTIRRQMLADRD